MGIATLAGTAWGTPADEENARSALKRLAVAMRGVAPDPGRDTAPVRPAPWCKGVVRGIASSPLAVSAAFERWTTDGFLSLIKAARYSCDYTNEPAGQVASTMIEQTWINLTGLSEADAIESISARVRERSWEADHKKLCDALTVSDEVRGEDRAFMATRRILFGCPGHAQWGEREELPSDLIAFIDQSDVPADELVRLSRILDRVSEPLNSTNVDHQVVRYAIDAPDFRELAAFTLNLLDAPPYAGNRYARVIAQESLGRARLGIATLEAEVKKRVSDADWKELLISAPQRGIEAYRAAAQAAAAPIARSNAFEHKAFGGSKRAVAGCLPELRKDFVEVYQKLPHASASQARESLSDPIASLLFGRLLVCMGLDGDVEVASEIYQRVAPDVRRARGVRTAAYYATLEALGKIRADRERFPLAPSDLAPVIGHLDVLHALRPNKRTSFDYEGSGIVKAVHKIAAGLHVTFVTSKHQEMSRSCTATNRIVQIRSDGSIQYYQNCRDTGLVTVNNTPEEITIPALLADHIVAGCAIEFGVTGGHKLERIAVPRVVYADKAKKKVVNYVGFAL
ncbi:MAG: hypothetical protein ABIY55_26915 [Kofleriaceae bacterium]